MWMGIDVLFWDDFFLTISFFIIGMFYIGKTSITEKTLYVKKTVQCCQTRIFMLGVKFK